MVSLNSVETFAALSSISLCKVLGHLQRETMFRSLFFP